MREFRLKCAGCSEVIVAPETVIEHPGACPSCGTPIDVDRYACLVEFKAERAAKQKRQKAAEAEARKAAEEEARRQAKQERARQAELRKLEELRRAAEVRAIEAVQQEARADPDVRQQQQEPLYQKQIADDIRAIRQWVTFGGIVLLIIVSLTVLGFVLALLGLAIGISMGY